MTPHTMTVGAAVVGFVLFLSIFGVGTWLAVHDSWPRQGPDGGSKR